MTVINVPPGQAVEFPLNNVNFELVVGDLMVSDGLNEATARQALNQVLIFLGQVIRHPEVIFKPDALTDVAWHRFMLRSRAYVAWCEQHAGRYLHHDPAVKTAGDCRIDCDIIGD